MWCCYTLGALVFQRCPRHHIQFTQSHWRRARTRAQECRCAEVNLVTLAVHIGDLSLASQYSYPPRFKSLSRVNETAQLNLTSDPMGGTKAPYFPDVFLIRCWFSSLRNLFLQSSPEDSEWTCRNIYSLSQSHFVRPWTLSGLPALPAVKTRSFPYPSLPVCCQQVGSLGSKPFPPRNDVGPKCNTIKASK